MTIVDALQAATAALNNAVQNVLGIRDAIAAQLAVATAASTTVINNFLARPLDSIFYVDPVGGDDTKDGSTYALRKKTLDNVFDLVTATQAIQNVVIYLFADDTITKSHQNNANLVIYGSQLAANAAGRITAQRTISFLGTSTNSPDANGNYYCGSLNFNGSFTVNTANIDYTLPDVPSNVTVPCHINTGGSLFVSMGTFNIKASSNQASALFSSNGGKFEASINPVFGTFAAGHLFYGVAAGQDPNAYSWNYSTNVKSA